MKNAAIMILLCGVLSIACDPAHAVTADIRANNSGGRITITPEDSVSLAVKLDAEGVRAAADWWLAADTALGWYYYNALRGAWSSGFDVSHQGPLFTLASREVLNISGLAEGTYTLYFGVDSLMNGSVDGTKYYDTIVVDVVNRNSLPDIHVDVHDSAKACAGTTLFADLHDQQRPRIVEVNMKGLVVWQYLLPVELQPYTNPGLDVERLSNDNILFVAPLKGVFEINRSGTVVWSYLDEKISHDADRLSNGNTLFVFGGNDQVDDPHVREINQSGGIEWEWYAKNEYNVDPYIGVYDGGWTHANAVTRMADGNTLVNLRNFDLTAVVNPAGSTVRTYDWSAIGGPDCDPHEPELLANGNLLICLQKASPCQAAEIDMNTGAAVWTYSRDGLRTTRDANRLPNGNTLIVGVVEEESAIFEVTPDGEIVWQLKVKDAPATGSPGYFYKAERIVSTVLN
jgi:hypothetical protein